MRKQTSEWSAEGRNSAPMFPASEERPVRLNRYIARAGVCSRRKADELIAGGRVRVNGTVVTQMGVRIENDDVVEVGGRRISPSDAVYVLLNKPVDAITTVADDRGRRTVVDLVDLPEAAGIFPVGRLDRNTTGVLLLTNDGEMAHRLMHPSFQVEKMYRVLTDKGLTEDHLRQLSEGIELEDGIAKADRVTYLDADRRNEIGILLHEGRNRQVRRMMAALGVQVVQLERVRYSHLDCGGIRRGKWRQLSEKEVRALRKLVGLKH